MKPYIRLVAGTIKFCFEKGGSEDKREHRSGFTPGHSEDGDDKEGIEEEEEEEEEELSG